MSLFPLRPIKLYFSGHVSTIAIAVILILYCFFLLQLSLSYKNVDKIKVHPAIVLCFSCIAEKVGLNKKKNHKSKMVFPSEKRVV
jgi:hypothetical protein